MEENQRSALECLPLEMLVHILSYLSSDDILNVLQTNSYLRSVCLSRKIVRTSRFPFNYTLTNSIFDIYIVKNPEACFMKVLDLNGVHWISLKLLRAGITKLKLLEELYVLDTKLDCTPFDMRVYNSLTKLKKLALTVRLKCCPPRKDLMFQCPLTHLCLHFFFCDPHLARTIQMLAEGLPNMESLKVFTGEQVIYFYYTQGKIIIKPKKTPRQLIYTYERADSIEAPENYFPVSLREELVSENFQTHGNRMFETWAFSPSDALKISSGKAPLKSYKIQALLFRHWTHDDWGFAGNTDILHRDTMRELKEISFPTCAFTGVGKMDYEGPSFKNAKIVVRLLEYVANNCPYLEDLELTACVFNITSQFHHIKKMKNLKRLSIFNYPEIDMGKCLVEICHTCSKLSYLRIISSRSNPALNISIYTALAVTKQLKHLRIGVEQDLNVDRILTSIPVNGHIKHVFLSSKSVNAFSEKVIDEFLRKHKSLDVLCVLTGESIPKSKLKIINKNLCKAYPDKFIKICQTIEHEECSSLPFLYFQELKNASHVCRLNLYDPNW